MTEFQGTGEPRDNSPKSIREWLRSRFSRPSLSGERQGYQPGTLNEDLYFTLATMTKGVQEHEPISEDSKAELLAKCKEIIHTGEFTADDFHKFAQYLAKLTLSYSNEDVIVAEGFNDPFKRVEYGVQTRSNNEERITRIIAKSTTSSYEADLREEMIRWSSHDEHPTLHAQLDNDSLSYDSYFLDKRVHSNQDAIRGSTHYLKRTITPEEVRLACERVLELLSRSDEETQRLLKEQGLEELDTVEVSIPPVVNMEERERLERACERLIQSPASYEVYDEYLKNLIRLIGGKAGDDPKSKMRDWEETEFIINDENSYQIWIKRLFKRGKRSGSFFVAFKHSDSDFSKDDILMIDAEAQYADDDEAVFATYEPRKEAAHRLTWSDITKIIPEEFLDTEENERIRQRRLTSIAIPKDDFFSLIHKLYLRYKNSNTH